ncbi:hypothetical protein C0993_007965 [Termitomyces sp. T159_Od127]|nr:hypothetical protein C0993_007965 [Termitomyces sp. T159_Od127]
MATFLAAFLLMCFVRATVVVRSIVAISTLLILGLIGWCIWMFWEETDVHWRETLKSIQGWLIKKMKMRKQDSATSDQGDDGYENESKHDNGEMCDNGMDHGHGTSSTEQDGSQGNILHSWLTWAKSWRRNRWGVAISDSRFSGEKDNSRV